MPASLYLQNKWLNHTFGNAPPFTQPSHWWVQLHYGDPTITCIEDAWYQAGRAEITDWTTAAARANASDESAAWADLTDPTGILTEVSWISIWDADITSWPGTIGNPLTYGQLTSNVPVWFHGTITFNVGDITNTVT